jgi:hypothetical protein
MIINTSSRWRSSSITGRLGIRKMCLRDNMKNDKTRSMKIRRRTAKELFRSRLGAFLWHQLWIFPSGAHSFFAAHSWPRVCIHCRRWELSRKGATNGGHRGKRCCWVQTRIPAVATQVPATSQPIQERTKWIFRTNQELSEGMCSFGKCLGTFQALINVYNYQGRRRGTGNADESG